MAYCRVCTYSCISWGIDVFRISGKNIPSFCHSFWETCAPRPRAATSPSAPVSWLPPGANRQPLSHGLHPSPTGAGVTCILASLAWGASRVVPLAWGAGTSWGSPLLVPAVAADGGQSALLLKPFLFVWLCTMWENLLLLRVESGAALGRRVNTTLLTLRAGSPSCFSILSQAT